MFEMFATLGKWNARREICSTSHIAGRRRYENTELRPSFLRRKVASPTQRGQPENFSGAMAILNNDIDVGRANWRPHRIRKWTYTFPATI
jgi:hypothetical protein